MLPTLTKQYLLLLDHSVFDSQHKEVKFNDFSSVHNFCCNEQKHDLYHLKLQIGIYLLFLIHINKKNNNLYLECETLRSRISYHANTVAK